MDSNNNFMYLGPDSINILDNIEVTLKQNSIDQSIFDDAYREFSGIINLIQNFEHVKPINDKFDPLFNEAKDRIKVRHTRFHCYWIAEIIALALNVYLLPNVLTEVNGIIFGNILSPSIFIIEISQIVSTIIIVAFHNLTVLDKQRHVGLIKIWIVLTFLVCLITYPRYL